jgi:elongation factor 1 alpha-like protein
MLTVIVTYAHVAPFLDYDDDYEDYGVSVKKAPAAAKKAQPKQQTPKQQQQQQPKQQPNQQQQQPKQQQVKQAAQPAQTPQQGKAQDAASADASALAAPTLESFSSNSIMRAAVATMLADKAAQVAAVTAASATGGEKPSLHMAVVGHVDSGKSTLVGHLLLKQGRFTSKDFRKAEKASVAVGKSSFEFAFLMDENEEERRRGVTVDVGQNWFDTETLRVNVLDCPGHRDFVPNMVAGAVRADAAVLVISALPGEFEAGFILQGQTKEHALLAHSLGISQVVVAVNKLDAVPDAPFSQARYDEIAGHVRPYLETIGFAADRISFVPISAFKGINLAAPTAAAPLPAELAAWYSGPPLLDAIGALAPPARKTALPFRLVATDVFSGTVSGKIAQGAVVPGEGLLISPGGVSVKVQAIRRNGEAATLALAGDDVELKLQCADEDALRPGIVLCELSADGTATKQSVPPVVRFQAQIISEQSRKKVPLLPGSIAVLHSATFTGPVAITKLVALLDEHGSRVAKPPRFIPSGTTAVVEITVRDRAAALLLPVGDLPEIARFSLRKDDETCAVGFVTEIVETAAQVKETAKE